MGYVDHNIRRPWLVLDFETSAIPDVRDYVSVAPEDAPKTHTKPDTIAKWVTEETARRIEKAAVDIDLARIVATGLWASDDDGPQVWTGDTEDSERFQLETFWSAYRDIVTERGGVLVCYNGLSFDLPLAVRRSQLLGIPYEMPNLYKYKSHPVIDVANELTFYGAKPMRSQAFYCKRFGIDVPDDTSGADMPRFIAAGDWAAVRRHNLADLQRTQALAYRLGFIGPAAGMVAGQEAVA